jgi:hypothetical protein
MASPAPASVSESMVTSAISATVTKVEDRIGV